MDTLKTIIFVSEKTLEEEQALYSWALELATKHQAFLKVVRILPAVSPGLAAWLQNSTPMTLQQQQQEKQVAILKPWLQQAEQVKVKVSLDVQFGKLFFKVIEQVLDLDADLVVKLADDAESTHHSLFGSQDLHLLRKCPCAILLHKGNAVLPYQNVVASIDVDVNNLIDGNDDTFKIELDSQRLNGRILNWAKRLHPVPGLKVIHAWQSEAEELVYHWNTDWTELDMLKFNEKERELHQKAMDLEVEPYRQHDPKLQTFLPKGIPQKAILNWLEENPCDLLVMGTVARVGVAGWFIGNTAEEILQQVSCSVLAIKPKGFVTPVKVE
ncbi:MAG: universal stress protein [Thiomicrorhabdus chilensis]|uniref:universal stress protein n=1 Tax=Thiomicrorhabdus chilensis TaxID=63656 RepID=UPI00299E8130|nr:universal stress protein [Thiomicrorhabdus chilensis]MDX1348054.1 universal stress protein [Thiomicrorhabdus chilensis]